VPARWRESQTRTSSQEEEGKGGGKIKENACLGQSCRLMNSVPSPTLREARFNSCSSPFTTTVSSSVQGGGGCLQRVCS